MNYFFVFQNKTYDKEMHGNFLWAPQGKCSHWKNMTNIHKGDVIFHSYHKKIVAISIAESNCYAASQPKGLFPEGLWQENGWKVDCQYYIMKYPIVTSDYMEDILKLQPTKYAPFNRIGRGNTGYLFNCTKELASFLVEKLTIMNKDTIKTIGVFNISI